jgi:hypothetical protein
VVQGNLDFPHEANGYHGVVPTAEVVVSRQDKANKLKRKASAHQLFKKKKRRQNTLLTRTVIISVGQGLARLDELSGLLGRLLGGIRVGCLIIIIWVAHDRLQRRGDGESYLVILKQDFYPCVRGRYWVRTWKGEKSESPTSRFTIEPDSY